MRSFHQNSLPVNEINNLVKYNPIKHPALEIVGKKWIVV